MQDFHALINNRETGKSKRAAGKVVNMMALQYQDTTVSAENILLSSLAVNRYQRKQICNERGVNHHCHIWHVCVRKVDKRSPERCSNELEVKYLHLSGERKNKHLQRNSGYSGAVSNS